MNLLEETKLLLRKHQSLPKKSFGQNFIIDRSIYEHMTEYASIEKSDIVLDIGAGLGFLSRLLAEKCKNVLAIEVDAQLATILREQLTYVCNARVIVGDVLKADIPPFNKIVSAPPYDISSRLILWMLQQNCECGVLVLQKEFAAHLVASIGSEEYGWLTVFTYHYAEVELLDDVSKTAFWPQPKVDSVITRLVLKRRNSHMQMSDIAFRRLLQVLFTHRNRKVKGAILSYLRGLRGVTKLRAVEIAERLPYSDKRVRELGPEDFEVLANTIN
jgi:16S rRNA (adenine1518-N6/adenine1519-N6)-dimethyltransferase